MNRDVWMLFGLIVLAFFAAAFSGNARAAVSVTPEVGAYNSGIYKPFATPAYTPGTLSGTASVKVGSNVIQFPAKFTPSAGAARAAKLALWSNPWLQGLLLMAWANDAGLGSDVVNGGGWVYKDPKAQPQTIQLGLPPPDPGVNGCRASASSGTNGFPDWGYCDGSMEACAAAFAPLIDGRHCVAVKVSMAGDHYMVGAYNTSGVLPNGRVPYTATPPAGCDRVPGTTQCVVSVQPRAATEADFEALPDPQMGVYAELAPQVGVEVNPPTYDFAPITQTEGAPYTAPDGSTVQPEVTVSPNGTQVYVQTFNQPVTDASGNPVTNPKPQDTTDQLQKDQCVEHPDSLGCTPLGSAQEDAIGHQDRNIALVQPVAVGGAGSCPADLTGSFLGHPVAFSFAPLCTYANTLRPLVLALAWLSAGVIFIGGVRNG
jgi:hypothetical protein